MQPRSKILTGWKEIAKHLGCGIRTAQRWEQNGLPVSRPVPGKRSHVVADSEQLDWWVRNGALRRSGRADLLASVERARKLRAEIQRARADLHLKMETLRKEMGAIATKRRKL